MPLTGQLGVAFSQPGTLQPGFAVVQGKVQWLGPWYGVNRTVGGAAPGSTLTTDIGTAQQLVNSDQSWWWAH